MSCFMFVQFVRLYIFLQSYFNYCNSFILLCQCCGKWAHHKFALIWLCILPTIKVTLVLCCVCTLPFCYGSIIAKKETKKLKITFTPRYLVFCCFIEKFHVQSWLVVNRFEVTASFGSKFWICIHEIFVHHCPWKIAFGVLLFMNYGHIFIVFFFYAVWLMNAIIMN